MKGKVHKIQSPLFFAKRFSSRLLSARNAASRWEKGFTNGIKSDGKTRKRRPWHLAQPSRIKRFPLAALVTRNTLKDFKRDIFPGNQTPNTAHEFVLTSLKLQSFELQRTMRLEEQCVAVNFRISAHWIQLFKQEIENCIFQQWIILSAIVEKYFQRYFFTRYTWLIFYSQRNK